MKTYEPRYIVEYARENSEYHKELYKDLPQDYKWEDIPLIDSAHYWNSKLNRLTGEQLDGHIFKSGGTTGEPKYSVFSHDEWVSFCEGTAINLPRGGLKSGDKIANIYFAGAMYASFLYTYSMLCLSPAKVVQYSLSGSMEISSMLDTIKKHKINCIAAIPTSIMVMMEYIEQNKIKDLSIEIVYFAGETLQVAQREKICEVLGRDIEFRSMAYASNDGGLIGYFTKDCGFNEHRANDLMCKIEIIDDETGEVITEKNRAGTLYITALYRTLMPIIRYPVGDMAEYTEDEGIADRKFRILGRSNESLKFCHDKGGQIIYLDDVNKIVNSSGVKSDAQQLIATTTTDNKQLVTIYVAVNNPNDYNEEDKEKILKTFYNEYKIMLEGEELNEFEKTQIVFTTLKDLECNSVTGKLKRIIDKR